PLLRSLRPAAGLSGGAGDLPGRLGAVGRFPEHGAADRVPDGAGIGRRRVDDSRVHDHRRAVRSGAARAHAGLHLERVGTRVADGPMGGRAPHRSRVLALGLLHQSAVRRDRDGLDRGRVDRGLEARAATGRGRHGRGTLRGRSLRAPARDRRGRAGGIVLAAFVAVERRAVEPIVPLRLFGNRMVLAAVITRFLAGMAMFGALSFVPLFLQSVTGASATRAGLVLTPFVLGWVVMSVVSARLVLRVGYRTVVVIGMASLTAAFLLFWRWSVTLTSAS